MDPNYFMPSSIGLDINALYASQLGKVIKIAQNNFYCLEEFDIAIVGVLEGRNAINNMGCSLGADAIREKFYTLHYGNYFPRILDLGNIKAGKSVADTYIAVKEVLQRLIQAGLFPIVLGGGQDLSYAQYMAYEKLERKVDLVVIDSHLDLEELSSHGMEVSSAAYLHKIFVHKPNYLFNYSHIGYQSYFVSQHSLQTMQELHFDVHRLGDLHGKIAAAEPVIRNADLISFDISAVRSSDACGNANATPNGFSGEEACQLCRYAGMNDKLTSLGFYEFNPDFDCNGQTALLLSEMLWYFVDGFYHRKKDIPLQPKSQYITYRAVLKDHSHELIFIKSKKTDRWWAQVPYPNKSYSNERYHLVPCSYEDYQLAVSGEMPDIWWRTYQKLC